MTTLDYGAALQRLLSSPTLPKLGLTRMRALMQALGDPQLRYPVLHIAGTKGKGSTAAMSSSMLRAAGLRVGMTTSPHLLSARERIVIDGVLVDEAVFCAVEERVHQAALSIERSLDVPSFFERLIAMSLCAFADAGVDVAVVEVGLGGRLDATNIVRPAATAITRLGIDHKDFLGDTLEAIATEKAGIIKAGAPALTISQPVEAMEALNQAGAAAGVDVVVVPVDPRLRPALFGAHQVENASLAVALVRAGGFDVDDAAVSAGLASVVWPGRYERVGERVILDGAHNAESARALRLALDSDERLKGLARHFVIGMSGGHDVAAFVDALVPGSASIVATRAQQPRALPAADIAHAASRHAIVDVVEDVAAAVEIAQGRGGVVVVTGSLFVVGEARGLFVAMPRDPARPAY
ncbi:MAG: folylpolyglutamate synthase/dihydrofolate synthase family protein [Deltaproteobacteria bacterium]|nr:folylpolyglutamate synthase/dihydrofolate synthase family protein [Deltaproteobacteria bacterium]